MEDGGDWGSLSFFSFSEIEFFIFGGFELGLGKWASCKWLGLNGLWRVLGGELNWATREALAFLRGGRGELIMDEQDVQDKTLLLCILSILVQPTRLSVSLVKVQQR